NSKCYKVLEREERSLLGSGIQNEKALARSDETKKSKVAEKNQVYSADYLLTYAITALKKGGEGFHLGWLTAIAGAIIGGKEGNALAGLDVAFSNDHVYLTCRITDTASSEILASSQVKVKDSNVSFGFDGGALSGKGGGLGGIEFFKQSKVGKMVASAVQKCSIQLSHELFKKGLLYETAPVESKPLLETKPSTKPHLSKKTSSRKKVKSDVKPSKQIVKGRN
ncbi:MAG: hypothetical protein JNK65_09460, partial [Deltaproteobacteria bacterium]|nr:hypothetical protein [Deltaproteobacteria bacterium]